MQSILMQNSCNHDGKPIANIAAFQYNIPSASTPDHDNYSEVNSICYCMAVEPVKGRLGYRERKDINAWHRLHS